MPTHDLFITLIIIAAVVFAIVRQVAAQPVRVLQFVILPALAAYEAYRALPRPTIPMTQIIEGLLVIAVALVVGAVQARFTRVYYNGDRLYMRGGNISLVAWIALVLARVIIGFAFQGVSLFTSFHSVEWILWAAIAVAFGSKSFILYMRHPEIGRALANERQERQSRRRR